MKKGKRLERVAAFVDGIPLKNRAYVLRYRPAGAKRDKYIPVYRFNITTYHCGLKVGESIRLVKDTGTYRKGAVFKVLTGAEEDPSCLWTLDDQGKTCEWDDDESVFETFQRIGTGRRRRRRILAVRKRDTRSEVATFCKKGDGR